MRVGWVPMRGGAVFLHPQWVPATQVRVPCSGKEAVSRKCRPPTGPAALASDSEAGAGSRRQRPFLGCEAV